MDLQLSYGLIVFSKECRKVHLTVLFNCVTRRFKGHFSNKESMLKLKSFNSYKNNYHNNMNEIGQHIRPLNETHIISLSDYDII